MPELENPIVEIENQEEVDPIAIIEDMRNNTVPKDKYNKLMADNAKLMKALANGEVIQVEAPNTPNIEDLRKEYFNFENKTDLQIAKDTLALRNALIEAGEPDPFLPNGKSVDITEQDEIDANRVADLLEYAINASNDSNAVFLAQLSNKLLDTSIPRQSNRRR